MDSYISFMKITNLFTGERVRCEITKVNRTEILSCKKNYSFDWENELRYFEVYKLSTEENQEIIQALFSVEAREGFIWMSKIERSNFKGTKAYEGILEAIVGFACNKSFELGFDGFVSFEAKSRLIPYYEEKLGALQVGNSQRMVINFDSAKKLINLFHD